VKSEISDFTLSIIIYTILSSCILGKKNEEMPISISMLEHNLSMDIEIGSSLI